jgi:hypothetical protein
MNTAHFFFSPTATIRHTPPAFPRSPPLSDVQDLPAKVIPVGALAPINGLGELLIQVPELRATDIDRFVSTESFISSP